VVKGFLIYLKTDCRLKDKSAQSRAPQKARCMLPRLSDALTVTEARDCPERIRPLLRIPVRGHLASSHQAESLTAEHECFKGFLLQHVFSPSPVQRAC
jgi:hypothetical protein